MLIIKNNILNLLISSPKMIIKKETDLYTITNNHRALKTPPDA